MLSKNGEVKRLEMTQGKRSTDETIKQIKRLLAKTDLTIPEIANRMGRSRANIVAINQKFKIRNYKNRRQHWDVDVETTS